MGGLVPADGLLPRSLDLRLVKLEMPPGLLAATSNGAANRPIKPMTSRTGKRCAASEDCCDDV